MYGVENWIWENQEEPVEEETVKDCDCVEIGTIWRVCAVECDEDTDDENERLSLQRGHEVWQSLIEEDEDFQRGYEEEEERVGREQMEEML